MLKLEMVWKSACLQQLGVYPDFKARKLNPNVRFEASLKCSKSD